MSKLKTPRAKKVASLERDRRTSPGKSSKAARKIIPRAKARTQREERRAVHQAVAVPDRLTSDEGAERAETLVAQARNDQRSKGFRKNPDLPLGEVIASKRKRRRS
jgi:hypothetical protein